MSLGIPGQVVDLAGDHPDLATVEVSGVRRMVNVGLLVDDPVGPGGWVVGHVGFAMSRMDEEEAHSAMSFLQDMGQAYREEGEALEGSVLGPTDDTEGDRDALRR